MPLAWNEVWGGNGVIQTGVSVPGIDAWISSSPVQPADYTQFAVRLEKGDLVVIYTDALIEPRGPSGRGLGKSGLLELVRTLDVDPSESFHHRLLAAVATRHGRAPTQDDETLLVLHHNAVESPDHLPEKRCRTRHRC
jgi:hypothetical protein